MQIPKIVFVVPDTMIRLWDYMPNIDLMINSIRWKWEKPTATTVWVDSGGYQVMVKGMKLTVDDVLSRYRRIEGDYFMSLDIPPSRFCYTTKELVNENIKNFEYLYSKLDDKNIVPIIHCYESSLFFKALDVYKSYGVKLIGYGGAVPPSLAKGGRGSRTTPLIPLALLSKLFNGDIHALGIGGTSTLYTALKIVGVKSMDSSSWRVKAAYGKVIVPGCGERYVGNGKASFGRKDLSKEDFEKLVNALQKSGFPYIEKVDMLIKTFRGRAIINAWIVKHYPDVLEKSNGYSWIIEYVKKIARLNVDELIKLLDKRIKSLYHN
ncbi:hypothetical protein QPL79_08120 [Ignisphaera sp. 4213-co]|mgnify:CR=1 FL=1|uniref:tRNA-ribosyltransferase n=1 Tax=Ignisphaera cupida TaxID=3050454 RepID=A0ABD4Z7K7_9CREN|nr:hypothetical protein [Ignisphaera sp. 4213-co]MDK6029326.1 hypothetical protein [Ignisphaera sp. 4213-co]